MFADGNITEAFNDVSAYSLPETEFCQFLEERFSRETAVKVASAFSKLGLPMPEKEEEFLDGAEGGLVFVNKYGLVIRIENKNFEDDEFKPARINNSGFVVQSLATMEAGEAVIEVIPGCKLASKDEYRVYLKDNLAGQGINFFDRRISNIGHLPVTTPSFPEGVPVVIDRLAVGTLSAATGQISDAMKQQAAEAATAQEQLYGPLKTALQSGLAQPGQMKNFWKMCESYMAEGKLVSAWAGVEKEGAGKPYIAAQASKKYASKFGVGA